MFDYYVYTDGACSRNGRTNAKAGIGIYFGENDPRNISECIIGKQTNNTAELKAIIKAFDIIKNDIPTKKIAIVSDSIYAIRCCTTYGEKIINNPKKIPNKELVLQAYKLYRNTNVKFIHIAAHTNNNDIHSIGNKNADKLATAAIN